MTCILQKHKSSATTIFIPGGQLGGPHGAGDGGNAPADKTMWQQLANKPTHDALCTGQGATVGVADWNAVM